MIWIEIELNIVIIVASIPLLRPLLDTFIRTRQRLPDENSPGWDTTTFSSVYSKAKSRTRVAKVPTSSEENIVPPNSEIFEMDQTGIHVTKEVSVSYHPTEVPFVHAALVGLIQGEIANPKLVHR